MQKFALTALLGSLLTLSSAALSASDAHALVRLGFDLEYVPFMADTVAYQEFDDTADSEPKGFGASVHVNFGADVFSIGPKINVRRRAYEQSSLDYTELDANLMARVQLPTTDLAIFAEGGAALSLDFGGVGYNVGLGVEYDVLGLPLLDLHIGLGVNWRDLPSEREMGGEPKVEIDTSGLSGIIFIGMDFSL